jgi:hypothetical protein
MQAHIMQVRPEIASEVVRILEQDGQAPEGLLDAVRAGTIDLAAPRSAEEAAHDGQAATAAGYLLGLIRDTFLLKQLGDWRQFVALGALAVDIEAAEAVAA